MKAVVGLDGSAHGANALTTAGRLLDPAADQLILYYAPPAAHIERLQSLSHGVWERARTALTQAVFQEAEANLHGFANQIKHVIGGEKPQQGLLETAEREGAGFIAVGARGAGPLERLLLGSVSRTVVHASKVPVLVVRAEERPIANVLLACDGSSASERVGRFVSQLTWQTGTTGCVIRVVEPMFPGHVPDWLMQQARSQEVEAAAKAFADSHVRDVERARAEMQSYCETLPTPFQGDPIIAEGHPTEQIITKIDRDDIDLVICGARGLGAVKRVVLGSTSEYLLSHAKCSVFVVP